MSIIFSLSELRSRRSKRKTSIIAGTALSVFSCNKGSAEKILNVKLPEQYISFLQMFGHGAIGGIEVLVVGLTGRMIFVDTTLDYREEELSENFVAIENM